MASTSVHVEVLSHRADPRRRDGRYLELWTVRDRVSRLITARVLGVLVMAVRAHDGEPIEIDVLAEIDRVARDHVRAERAA